MRNQRHPKIKEVPVTILKLPSPKPQSHSMHPYNGFILKIPILEKDGRIRFSGLKMNDKSKGANTEITMGLRNLFLADIGILSCDLKGNSACSRDLLCKGDQTRIPYGLEGCGGQGKGVRRGHLDLTFLDLWN